MISTIDEALRQLEAAEQDALADGQEDYSFSDLVEAIAWDVAKPIKGEFYRRTLGWEPR